MFQCIVWHLHKLWNAAQPDHVPLIGTSDNRKGQCLVNNQKPFLVLLFTREKMLFNFSRLQLVRQPMILHVSKLLLSTPNDWWSNASNFSVSNLFGVPESNPQPTFNIKIIVFEASEPISACCFRQSMVAVSFSKYSVCFSCKSFLISIFRLKIWVSTIRNMKWFLNRRNDIHW